MKIVRAVFEIIAKKYEKWRFSTLKVLKIKIEIQNRKSGSVSQIVPFFRDFVQNLKNIHIVEHTELADDTHTHTHTHTH